MAGAKVTLIAYLPTYVEQTEVIDPHTSSKLLLSFWIWVTLGRFLGIQDLRFITNDTLPSHYVLLSLCGLVASALILIYPKSSQCLWIGVSAYGAFNGPLLGYCYDYANRLTYPTEESMAIVMFGLNTGASLVPFFTTLAWRSLFGPRALILVLILSMFLPLPLLWLAKHLKYTREVPNVSQYESISQIEPLVTTVAENVNDTVGLPQD
jgi:fucose permease